MGQEKYRNVIVGVDMQNDFVDGSLPVNGANEIFEPFNAVANTARQCDNTTVVLTRDWHPQQTPHFDTWPIHCVEYTHGAAFHPDLDVYERDVIISKGLGQTDGYSGTEGVSEDGQTLERIVTLTDTYDRVRVFLGGLATDFCVKATGIGIAEVIREKKNVELYLLRDAIRGVNIKPADDERAIKELAAHGYRPITSTDAIELISHPTKA